MRKIAQQFIALMICVMLASLSLAKANQATIIPNAPTIDAKAYILVDATTGAVLAANNPDQRLAPASLTKLMTLYVVFDQLKKGTIHLTDQVRVSEKAWRTPGSRMFLREGMTPTVEELIQGVIVDSGNDACVALAEFVAGTTDSFAGMMNNQAKQLGMKNTHFMDVNGLPSPDHYTTARDLAILTRALIQNFPDYYHYFSERWFEYNNIKQPNRNRLLWRYKYADGLKTGHTDEAGYCIIGSAEKSGMRLIAVVMGAPSDEARATDSAALLTYGFRFFTTVKVISANQAVVTPTVYFGAQKTVPVGLQDNLYVTVPAGSEKAITTSTELITPLKAPLAQYQAVGNVTVMLNQDTLTVAHLVALQPVNKGSFFARMRDHVALGFKGFFGGNKK